ncbi:MAG: peptide chain release factor-like protein [Planctomycetota bacterium]|nr:peptide chain release factor-like protein [Planctomycetota bacterium]
MADHKRDDLSLADEMLLAGCDVHIYKSSGPGGQHRNKVSSAVRLKHRATGLTAHGDGSRSQHENRRTALARLRMNLACRLRRPIDINSAELPPVVAECIFEPRGRGPQAPRRLEIGRKDRRFWQVGAFLLDVLEACEGRLAEAAAYLGITTSNLAGLLKSERHIFAAAQALRKNHGQKPLL